MTNPPTQELLKCPFCSEPCRTKEELLKHWQDETNGEYGFDEFEKHSYQKKIELLAELLEGKKEMTNNPPIQELLSCPFECDFNGNLKELYHHLEKKEDKSRIALKLAELVAQEGKIRERIEQRLKQLESVMVTGPCVLRMIDGVELNKKLHDARLEELKDLLK